MLTLPQLQRYASQSGLRNITIAEQEVILTYVLQLFGEKGILDLLAFKGGTCLRKLHLGSQGRFSTDLDFTAIREHEPDDIILEMMSAFEEPFHGITFALEDDAYYTTQDNLSWGITPVYKHDWNPSGNSEIKLQVSMREVPTLETQSLAQCEQSYFPQLPFVPREITSLALEEVIAEKIRACYQRDKARDIYDLGVFATRPLNQALIRRLVVLKVWQSGDSFDPARLIGKFEDGSSFDWSDLNDLVNRAEKIVPEETTKACTTGYTFLTQLSEGEAALASDAHKRENALWEMLRSELPET
ncbi:MAG: nucleotidyl transferase AbiEii/AbiGii toxin family protein [Pseudomonadales bacterium]